ncbi:MAG: DinB family protein [Chloracidobacterium sp.]|nr:DinB family protein [Chloracidobacterium sp.]
MNLNDIRRLFDYTDYANDLALNAAEKLTEEQRKYDFKCSHGSILGTLVHMAGAEWVWLERWKGTSNPRIWTVDDFNFSGVPDLRSRWGHVESDRRELLENLTEEKLRQDLSYKNLKGEPFTLPLVDQMQHVVNHSTLHRGQVVGMIRQLGLQPPTVDLIYYLIARK